MLDEVTADFRLVNPGQPEEELDVGQILERSRGLVLDRQQFHRDQVLGAWHQNLEVAERPQAPGPREKQVGGVRVQVDEIEAPPKSVAVEMVPVALGNAHSPVTDGLRMADQRAPHALVNAKVKVAAKACQTVRVEPHATI